VDSVIGTPFVVVFKSRQSPHCCFLNHTRVTNAKLAQARFGMGRGIGGDLVRGLGGRARRVSAEIFFLPSPPKCEIWGGDGGGLTVFVNFNI